MRRDAERYDRNRTRLRAARESMYGYGPNGLYLVPPKPDGKQLDLFEDYRPPIFTPFSNRVTLDIETQSISEMSIWTDALRSHQRAMLLAYSYGMGPVRLYNNS